MYLWHLLGNKQGMAVIPPGAIPSTTFEYVSVTAEPTNIPMEGYGVQRIFKVSTVHVLINCMPHKMSKVLHFKCTWSVFYMKMSSIHAKVFMGPWLCFAPANTDICFDGQVEAESREFSRSISLKMSVDQARVGGYSSSKSWCQSNIRAVKQEGSNWIRYSADAVCLLWPEYVLIEASQPGGYGYEVNGYSIKCCILFLRSDSSLNWAEATCDVCNAIPVTKHMCEAVDFRG